MVDGAKVSKLEKNILIDNKSLALNVGSNKVPSYVKNLKGITVNAIKSTTTTVKGSAPGTTKAYVASGSKILGTAAVGSDGKFSVKIKKQKKNTSLKVYAIDKRSNRVQVTVKVK